MTVATMQSALLGGEAPLKSAWQADAYDAKLWITDRPWLALYGNWLSPKPRREVWLAAGLAVACTSVPAAGWLALTVPTTCFIHAGEAGACAAGAVRGPHDKDSQLP